MHKVKIISRKRSHADASGFDGTLEEAVNDFLEELDVKGTANVLSVQFGPDGLDVLVHYTTLSR